MALNIDGTTGISGVDGSVSAPALTGTDSNTGITFPSADTIKFATGGVERLAISNSGLSGDGSGLTGITPGITNAQTWRITTNASLTGGGGNIIDSNWEEADTYGYTRIGSVATAPSGGTNYFSFGATGIYLLKFFATGSIGASSNVGVIQLESTFAEDGSTFNYPIVMATSVAGVSSNRFFVYGDVIFDVTDISTHRFRYRIYPSEANVTLFGSSNSNYTGVTFIKLGDT